MTDVLQLESASLSVAPEAVSSFDTWWLSMAGSHTLLQEGASLSPADYLDDDETTSHTIE